MHPSPLQARARHRPTTGQHPRARPQAARSAQMKTLATRPQPRQGRRSRPLPRSPRACGCNICRRRRCRRRHEPVAEEGRACSSSSCSAAEAQVAAPSAQPTGPGSGPARSLDEVRRCRGGASLRRAPWRPQPRSCREPARPAPCAHPCWRRTGRRPQPQSWATEVEGLVARRKCQLHRKQVSAAPRPTTTRPPRRPRTPLDKRKCPQRSTVLPQSPCRRWRRTQSTFARGGLALPTPPLPTPPSTGALPRGRRRRWARQRRPELGRRGRYRAGPSSEHRWGRRPSGRGGDGAAAA
mmetsp:Transcript_63474/g.170589  ORF Transcript_63474/g.170589 Transcript_63474/m.170589 type:complete len:296 (-) Transcript_63474:3-890(-)